MYILNIYHILFIYFTLYIMYYVWLYVNIYIYYIIAYIYIMYICKCHFHPSISLKGHIASIDPGPVATFVAAPFE
jgi:hypothetical protein